MGFGYGAGGLVAVLASLLELAVYVAGGYWALSRPFRLPPRLLLVAGAFVVLTAARAAISLLAVLYLRGEVRGALVLVWYGAGALALFAARKRWPALCFVGVWVVLAVLELTLGRF
jgi:hypothetical protein